MDKELKNNMSQAVEEMLVLSDWKDRKYQKLKNKFETNRQSEQKQFIQETLDDMIYEIEEREDENHWKLYKAKTARRLKLTAALMSLVMLACAIGFAWYTYFNREVVTEEMSVMTPYTLYLLEPGAQDYLTLSVGDLHPDETKQIVVCVSSHDKGGTKKSKQGVFSYQMELAYTDNLNLDYKVYALEQVKDGEDTSADDTAADDIITSEYTSTNDDGQTVTEKYYFKKSSAALTPSANSVILQEQYRNAMYLGEDASTNDTKTLDGIVNLGNYKIYDKISDNQKFQLNLGDDTKQYNYYLIEVTVDSDIDFSKYLKETDLIYLIAKAKLPDSEEITTAQSSAENTQDSAE